MKPIHRSLREVDTVPGMMNVTHGDVMGACKSADDYVRNHPEIRADHNFRGYANHAGKPKPKSVRIRDMKARIAILEREGRVK